MRRILFAIVIGLGGAAILVSLGVWQVTRLAWKEDLLARIEATIADAPAPLTRETERYAPVTVTGQFADGHLRILASRKQTGAVYRIIRPFQTDQGALLIDTGWILDDARVPEIPGDQITLVGNLDAPNEIDSFTPEPDLNANIWFARDVPAMAKALGTEPALIVLREAPQADLGATPWPVDTAGIPNDHLQYAITWFSLAAIWVGMSLYFLRRKPRSTANPV